MLGRVRCTGCPRALGQAVGDTKADSALQLLGKIEVEHFLATGCLGSIFVDYKTAVP